MKYTAQNSKGMVRKNRKEDSLIERIDGEKRKDSVVSRLIEVATKSPSRVAVLLREFAYAEKSGIMELLPVNVRMNIAGYLEILAH